MTLFNKTNKINMQNKSKFNRDIKKNTHTSKKNTGEEKSLTDEDVKNLQSGAGGLLL
jgi:hypothetical protein